MEGSSSHFASWLIPQQSELPVRLFGSANHEAMVTLPVKIRSFWLRMSTAAACWITLWALAIPIFFIPLVHLSLPLLILGAPVAAYFAYRRFGTILKTAVPCPDCAHTVPIESRSIRFPYYVVCPNCSQHICFEAKALP